MIPGYKTPPPPYDPAWVGDHKPGSDVAEVAVEINTPAQHGHGGRAPPPPPPRQQQQQQQQQQPLPASAPTLQVCPMEEIKTVGGSPRRVPSFADEDDFASTIEVGGKLAAMLAVYLVK